MPVESTRHVNRSLPDLSVKVMQEIEEYKVHRALFPSKNVNKMSDVYFIYNIADSFREAHDIRANRSESNQINELSISTSAYRMEEHSMHELVSDRDRENADEAVDPEFDAVADVTTILARNKELEAARTIFTSTAFGGGNLTTLSSNAWDNDTVTSNPIDDIDIGRSNIIQNTSKTPMGICMGFDTWQNGIKDHAALLDRIKYSERGVLSTELAAMVLGVDEIIVSKGIFRTTEPGISATTDYIFKSAALLYFNDSNPGIRSSNFGATFQKSTPVIDRMRIETKKSDMIEVSWTYDQKVILSLSGFFFASTDS